MSKRLTLHASRDASPEWGEKKALDELTREFYKATKVYSEAGIKVSRLNDYQLTDGKVITSYSSHV